MSFTVIHRDTTASMSLPGIVMGIDHSIKPGWLTVARIVRRAPPKRYPKVPKGWRLMEHSRDGDLWVTVCSRLEADAR